MPSTLEVPKVEIESQVDTWLAEQLITTPENPMLWKPRWSRYGTPVRGVEHLAVLISSLKLGAFAGVETDRGENRRWAQVMRTDPGWILEVHDGTVDDFASRVSRGPIFREQDSYWRQMVAAKVLLAWMHGTLVADCSRKRMR